MPPAEAGFMAFFRASTKPDGLEKEAVFTSLFASLTLAPPHLLPPKSPLDGLHLSHSKNKQENWLMALPSLY